MRISTTVQAEGRWLWENGAMQTLSSVRKHSTPAQRNQILRRYQRSQLTQKEFAAQAGLGVSTLQSWLRQAAPAQEDGGSGFLPAPNLLATTPSAPTYRIEWPGGLTLEVRPGFAREDLVALLAALPVV